MTPAGGPPDESRSLLMSAFERNAAVMSAFGTKQTWVGAPPMSAFGGKADMAFCGANVR